MIDKQGEEWAKHAHGLSYKVLIINTKRIYDNNIINTAKDAYVEASGTEGVYSYSVGLFSEYAGAERLRRELYKEGFKEAIVVPYVDGVRLFGEEAKRLSTRYSDLNNYLASKKKP
jgi:hypothetical protein